MAVELKKGWGKIDIVQKRDNYYRLILQRSPYDLLFEVKLKSGYKGASRTWFLNKLSVKSREPFHDSKFKDKLDLRDFLVWAVNDQEAFEQIIATIKTLCII